MPINYGETEEYRRDQEMDPQGARRRRELYDEWDRLVAQGEAEGEAYRRTLRGWSATYLLPPLKALWDFCGPVILYLLIWLFLGYVQSI